MAGTASIATSTIIGVDYNNSGIGGLVRSSPPRVSKPYNHRTPESSATTAVRVHPLLHYNNPDDVLNSLLRDLSFWECTDNTTTSATTTTTTRANSARSTRMTSLVPCSNSNHPSLQKQSSSLEAPSLYNNNNVNNNNREKEEDAYNSSYYNRHQQQYLWEEEKKAPTMPEERPSRKQQQQPQRIWKAAVDPTTGRTYYYDAVTRQTQWEKPDEIRIEERRLRKEKRRLDQLFFEEVKRNIIASLNRGELIPGISQQKLQQQSSARRVIIRTKQQQGQEGLVGAQVEEEEPPAQWKQQSQQQSLVVNTSSVMMKNSGTFNNNNRTTAATTTSTVPSQQQQPQRRQPSSSGSRIRTISGMNDKVLAELQDTTTAATLASISSSSSFSSLSASTITTAPSLSSTILHNNNLRSTTVVAAAPSRSATTPAVTAAASLLPAAAEGRPPLPQRGRSGGGVSVSGGTVATASTSGGGAAATTTTITNHPRDYFVTQDSMELSPDKPSHKMTTPGTTRTTMVSGESSSELLQGEHLLDEPIWENAATTALVASQWQQQQQPQQQQQASHIRRNTGASVFVQSTMENPDINATIKCVVAVFRAHIVQAADQDNANNNNNNIQLLQQQQQQNSFEIFRDETASSLLRGGTSTATQTPPVPSLEEIETFYHDFFRRSQMEHDTIIMSLIYVERLIKETNGALVPAPHNWKSVLFSCMVLSSKVWDDLSMFNLDFSNVSMACGGGGGGSGATVSSSSSSLSAFSLQRTNALEVAVLQTLNFNVRVAASEYAKYYFLIRTMLLRSGLLDEQRTSPKNSTTNSAASTTNSTGDNNGDVWGGQLLESRTSRYQDSLIKRRAKSVDWTLGATSSLIVVEQPVLRDTVCLEQLLLCNQQHWS